MATVTAPGYNRMAHSAQAYQPVVNRHVWDCDVRAAADLVKIGRLPAGHRLKPELCRLIGNGSQPVGNLDVYVDTAAQLLWNDQAFVAATYESNAVDAGAFAMCETIGVDFNQDRDIYLLINSGFATAPAGAKIIVEIASYPVPNAD